MAEALGNALSAFGKLATLAVIAVMFALGLVGTVYLSLRSPEIQVPDVVNKSYTDGTSVLAKAGLDISERAQRFKPDVQPGVILDQTPHAGEVVKSGQTVRVVVSRGPHEGEQPASVSPDVPGEKKDESANASRNDVDGKSSDSSNKNENGNRERRNKNANKNANSNANSNANNRNSGNANATNGNAAQRNTNERNANSNVNRNANRGLVINGNAAASNANRNRNANSRNTNTNSGHTNSNANRRPNF